MVSGAWRPSAWAQPAAKMLVHGRDRARGEQVVNAIRRGGGHAEFVQADLASLREVRGLAETPTSIMYNQCELLEPQSLHKLNLITRHCSFRVRFVIGGGRRL
jgi:hypothetical protein